MPRGESDNEQMAGSQSRKGAEEEKPKEEPKQDTRKTTRNGGYTIPVQMS